MPTFHCNAECEHCGTGSSPREHTRLSMDAILSAIDQAAAAGFCGIVFTGGEPTLAWEPLLAGVRRARSHGLGVRLVTNGHWGTERGAATVAGALADAGLTELNLSAGYQHARFIPVERVANAARAAACLGVPVSILVETTQPGSPIVEFLRQAADAIAAEVPHAQVVVVERVWSALDPLITLSPREKTVNRFNVSNCQGCDGILANYTLQADGRFSPCCGLAIRAVNELSLGAQPETTLFEAVSRAEADSLMRWIRAIGPERILAWAASHDPSIRWENLYEHRCHACLRLYTDANVRETIRRYAPWFQATSASSG